MAARLGTIPRFTVNGCPVETRDLELRRTPRPRDLHNCLESYDSKPDMIVELRVRPRDYYDFISGQEVEFRDGDFIGGGTIGLVKTDPNERWPMWTLELLNVWTGSRPALFEQPELLDPRENPDYLVWWNAVADSRGHDAAHVFADWLEGRGLYAAAAKIRESDSPALTVRRLVDLTHTRRDGRGAEVPWCSASRPSRSWRRSAKRNDWTR